MPKGNKTDTRRNLYMKNLKQGFKIKVKEELKEKLLKYGKIASMLVKSKKIENEDKLYAFVSFETHEDAKKVLKALNNKDIFGTGIPLYVNWAEKKNER